MKISKRKRNSCVGGLRWDHPHREAVNEPSPEVLLEEDAARDNRLLLLDRD